MTVRHFRSDDDLTPAEQQAVFDRATALKADPFGDRTFSGPRSVAIVFDKPSTRTRVSFANGVAQLGGYPLVIDAQGSQLGRGEPVADTVRVLDRQCAAIVWRTFDQERMDEAARVSRVPVVNALTDRFHPCQVLADLFTVREHKGVLSGLTLAYLGDGANNMAHSYLLGGALAGVNVRIGAPEGHLPDPVVVDRALQIAAETGGSIVVTTEPDEAWAGADVLATDTWVSMGEEGQRDAKAGPDSPFTRYAVTATALAEAAPDAVVLHCLPAYRGQEIAADVIDGPQSVVWDEAENRLHVQKALLCWLDEQSDRPELP